LRVAASAMAEPHLNKATEAARSDSRRSLGGYFPAQK
jgi:hypothetical protein